jgi:hypothetical protein
MLQIFGELATQGGLQLPGAVRRLNPSFENIHGRDRFPVVAVICFLLRRNHCAFDGRAREKSLAPAISIDRGLGRNRSLCIAPDWTRGHTGIDPESHVTATRKRAHGGIVIKNKNEISFLRTSLQTPAGTAGANERRTGPAMLGARDHDAMPSFAAKDETRFDYSHDGQPLRVPQHMPWNVFLRHVPKIPDDTGAMIDRLLVVGVTGGDESKRRDNDGSE